MRDRLKVASLVTAVFGGLVVLTVGVWLYICWALQARTAGWVTTLIIGLIIVFVGAFFTHEEWRDA